MQPKFSRLRGKMYENQVTQEDIAKLLGRSEVYVSSRITAKVSFGFEDAYKLCDYLGIPEEELHIYFPRGGIEKVKPVARQKPISVRPEKMKSRPRGRQRG